MEFVELSVDWDAEGHLRKTTEATDVGLGCLVRAVCLENNDLTSSVALTYVPGVTLVVKDGAPQLVPMDRS